MADYDVIVIGAGHNGMAAAATLAKQGMRVVVFEKQGEVGGMAATRELFEGYRHNVGAWALMVFDPQVMKELELKEYGLEVIEPDTSFCNFGVPGEKPFILYNSLPKLMLHLTRDHGMDAMGGLKNVFAFCAPFVDTWKRTRLNPPPSMGAILEQATSEQERDMLRKCFHLSAMDIVQEFFPDPEKHKLIQVMLAGMATDGTGVGPYDPGTAFSLVYHLVPAGVGQFYKLAKGGMGAVSEALRRSFEDKGGELRLRTPVKRVLVEKGRAVGVVLKDGETIRAQSVLSNLDARSTFLNMVGEQHLKSNFVKRVNQIKYGTPYIQIQLTLKELPQFTGDLAFANQDRINWFMSYSQGPEHLQRCVDICKWGDIPDDPMWAYYIPSVWDKTMSPPGGYSATIFSFYFPMKVGDGQHRELRNRLAESLIDSVDRYAPNFRKSIMKKAVFTWRNFASMYGITKGDYAHGVLMPEQMFDYRPMVGCADYRTPVENLYLCGAGCHPGPGVTAIPGRNCAMEVMKDMGASPETNTGLDFSDPIKTLGDLRDWGTKALSKFRN